MAEANSRCGRETGAEGGGTSSGATSVERTAVLVGIAACVTRRYREMSGGLLPKTASAASATALTSKEMPIKAPPARDGSPACAQSRARFGSTEAENGCARRTFRLRDFVG